jgi:outer membrane immunogenic protein
LKAIIFSVGLLFTSSAAFGSDSINWNGFYVGAFGAATSLDVRSDASARPGELGAGIGAGQAADAMAATMTYARRDTNAEINPGLYAGYQWQHGSFVVGLEADLQRGGSLKQTGDNRVKLRSFSNVQSYEYAHQFDLEYISTLMGRLGYADKNWLVYVTGGLAHGRVSSSLDSYGPLDGPVAPQPIFLRQNTFDEFSKSGWIVGIGGEVSLTSRLRLRTELVHFDLGDVRSLSQSKILHENGDLFASAVGEVDSKLSGTAIRVGLNYAF